MASDHEAQSGDGSELAGHREAWGVPRAARAVGILLLTGACLASVMAQWESPVRTALTLVFLFLVPGLAVAEAVDVSGLAHRLALATGGSLALDTLLALALVDAGVFSARLAIAVLAAFTGVAVALALVRRRVREDPVVARSGDAA